MHGREVLGHLGRSLLVLCLAGMCAAAVAIPWMGGGGLQGFDLDLFIELFPVLVIGTFFGAAFFAVLFLYSLPTTLLGLGPFVVWVLSAPERPGRGLCVAVVSSAVFLGVAGFGAQPTTAPPDGFPNDVLWHFPTPILVGGYLAAPALWLCLPLKLNEVWWRLALWASAGALLGGLVGHAIVGSHLGLLVGLAFCNWHHRRPQRQLDHFWTLRRPERLPAGDVKVSYGVRGAAVQKRG